MSGEPGESAFPERDGAVLQKDRAMALTWPLQCINADEDKHTVAPGIEKGLDIIADLRKADWDEGKGIIMTTRLHDLWNKSSARANGQFNLQGRVTPGGQLLFGLNPHESEVSLPVDLEVTPAEVQDRQDTSPDDVTHITSSAYNLADGSQATVSLFQLAQKPDDFCLTVTVKYANPQTHGANIHAGYVRGVTFHAGKFKRSSYEYFSKETLQLAERLTDDTNTDSPKAWRGRVTPGELLAATLAPELFGKVGGLWYEPPPKSSS